MSHQLRYFHLPPWLSEFPDSYLQNINKQNWFSQIDVSYMETSFRVSCMKRICKTWDKINFCEICPFLLRWLHYLFQRETQLLKILSGEQLETIASKFRFQTLTKLMLLKLILFTFEIW